MDKLKFLSLLSDSDEKILFSNIFDKIKKSAYLSYPLFTSFLTPLQQKKLDERKKIADKVNFTSYGGYLLAERKMFAFSNDEIVDFDQFPIDKIKITTKDKKVFDHRAYLGSVLSLGIKREKIGDIVIMQDCAIIFCANDITEFLLYNLNKISNSFVNCEIYYDEVIIEDDKRFKEVFKTVSSLRLDCVVSAFCDKSRSISDAFINEGLVSLNYEITKNNSGKISNGDVLSVRGYGKAILQTDFPLSKKGKNRILIKYYIWGDFPMLSPLDIENKKFINSAIGGYNKADVDKFKELILADYEKLYRENISFKDKINALTNAIDHYKAMEDTMQSTLLVAQAASDEVRNTATEKAKIIVEDAQNKADEIMRSANRELEKTNEKLEQLKREYILFKSKIKAEYQAQMTLLSEENN